MHIHLDAKPWGVTCQVFSITQSRIKSCKITSPFCVSFETSYDFTWGLASSSDRPTQLWMILSFYLLFACVGQEQHSLNSNRMIGRCFSLFKSLCLSVLLGAASALPLTLIELVETSAEKVPDEKRWWIKKWMKDATWRLWNCKNIDSCSCRSSARWRLPREGSYHYHGLNWQHTTEISMLNSQSLIFIIRATFETLFGCHEQN